MGNGTSIGRVRGLGPAHHGAHHWMVQRFTAIGNLVGMLFLVVSFVLLPNFEYATVSEWVSSPLPALVIGLLIVSVFWHARLGLQVLMEDYVDNSANRFALLAVLNVAAFGGAAFGLLCIVRLALGGTA